MPIAAAPAPTTKSPAPTGSARPPTNLNPTSQKPPTPPASNAPPTTKGLRNPVPDTPAAAASLRESLKATWNPAPPPSEPVKPAAEPPKSGAESPKSAEGAAPEPPKKPDSLFDRVKPKETPPAPEGDVDLFAHVKPPEGMSEAALSGWKALKTETSKKVRETERALAETQAQYELLKKATPADVAELNRIKAEHQSALDRLAVLDLQSHPDYVRQYVQPQQAALNEAKETLGFYEKQADFAAILAKSPKDFSAAVSELTKDMNAMDATSVQTALRNARKLSVDQQQALSKASELRSGLEAKTAQEQRKAFEEVYGKIGDGSDAFLAPIAIPEGVDPSEKAELESYNAAIAGVRPEAEKYAFGRMDAKGMAAVANKAATLDFIVKAAIPRMNKEHAQVVADLKTALAELAAIKGQKRPGSFEGAPTPQGEGQAVPWQQGLKSLYAKK